MRIPTHSIDHVEPKHLEWFITGAVHEWNLASGAGFISSDLQHYILDTIRKVDQFLRGVRDADSHFSDLQCTVALEAKKLFKPRVAWQAEVDLCFSVREEDWRQRANAIKRVRELTGWDLKASAAAVDAYRRSLDPTKPVVDGGICDHCGEPNVAHMGNDCRAGGF